MSLFVFAKFILPYQNPLFSYMLSQKFLKWMSRIHCIIRYYIMNLKLGGFPFELHVFIL